MQSDPQPLPSIDESGVLLLFARVSPGSEEDFYANSSQLPGPAYKCFGPYDLLTLQPSDTLKMPLVPDWAADSSPLGNPLAFPTFAWTVPGILPIDRQIHAGEGPFSCPVLGVIFLKLNDAILQRDGITLESTLARFLLSARLNDWLAERQQRATLEDIKLPAAVAVLGSIGWHEIILLVGAAEAEAVLRTWVALRQLRLSDLSNHAPNQHHDHPENILPVLKTTYTVVCLRRPELLQILAGDTEMQLGKVNAEICITCDAREQVRIDNIAREYFPDSPLEAIVGERDFVIRPKASCSFSQLTHSLMAFRRRVKREGAGLVSTETLLSTHFPIVNGDNSVENPTHAAVGLDPRIERAFVGGKQARSVSGAALKGPFYDPDTYARLKEAFDTLNWGLQDYRKAPSLDKLRPFAASVSNYLGERLGDPDIQQNIYQASELIRLASKCAELLKTGCDQAALGIAPLDSSPVYAPGGGLQRLLTATSSIPSQLLHCGEESYWTGFMVSGIHGEAQRYHFGVINVPRELLVDPSTWWQIIHEVGHEYSFVYSFENPVRHRKLGFLNRPEIDEIVRSYRLNQGGQRLIWEILADIFAFRFGFRGQWKEYLTVVWGLLKRLMRMRDPQQQAAWLLRAVMVKAFSQLGHSDPRQISFAEFDALRLEVLADLGDFTVADAAFTDELLGNENTEPFRRAFPVIANAIHEAEKLGFSTHADQPDSQMMNLDQGVPVHRLADPVGLVIRLASNAANGKTQDFRSTIAAFLSLWDAAIRSSLTPTTPEGVEGG